MRQLPAATRPTPITPAPHPAAVFSPPDWRLTWADEFNGTSVDGARWRVRNNEHNPNEQSCLTSRAQNVSVSGGLLHFKAQRENRTCAGYAASWTSGYLDTIGRMSRTYGRVEMRPAADPTGDVPGHVAGLLAAT